MDFDVIFKIYGDKEFLDKLKEMEAHSKKLEENLEKAGKNHFKEATTGAKEMGKELFEAVGAVELLKKGFEVIGEAAKKAFEFAKESFTEYRDLIRQETKIDLFLRNTQHNPELDSGYIKGFSKDIAEDLGIKLGGVESIAAKFLNVDLIAQNKNAELIENLTKLSYNLSAGTSLDPEAAAKFLGNLYQNPQRAVRGLGETGALSPEIKDYITKLAEQAKQTGNYTKILQVATKVTDYLNEKYKGFADELAKADPMTPINRALNRLEEELGPKVAALFTRISPELDKVIDKISDWVDSISEDDIAQFSDTVGILISATEDLADAFVWLASKFEKVMEGLRTHTPQPFEQEYMKAHPEEKFWRDMANQPQISSDQQADFRKWRKANIPIYGEAETFIAEERSTKGDLSKSLKGDDLNKWAEKYFGAGKFGTHEGVYEKDLSKLSLDKLVELTLDNKKLLEFQNEEEKKFAREAVKGNSLMKRLAGIDPSLTKGGADNIKGPKNTNIYVTINGGMGNFKIENSSTGTSFLEPGNRNMIKDEVTELLAEALADATNQAEARGKN